MLTAIFFFIQFHLDRLEHLTLFGLINGDIILLLIFFAIVCDGYFR